MRRFIYKPEDNIGKTFNELTIISYYINENNRSVAICLCSCGKTTHLRPCQVISGEIKSCGHIINKCKITHGLSNKKIYRLYFDMLKRCYDPNTNGYENYGGRGITVCDEWKNNKLEFFEWAKDKYEEGLSLERIDVNGNYCPENCKWVPYIEQCYNKRCTLYITAFGETKSIYDWINDDRCVIKERALIYDRIKKQKWSHEKAISTPKSEPLKITINNETKSITEWSKDEKCEIAFSTLFMRIKHGWKHDELILKYDP